MEEKLETTLSQLVSMTKTDIRYESVQHFCDIYCCVTTMSNHKTNLADPNFSDVLPYHVVVHPLALITHVEQWQPLPYIGFGSPNKKVKGQVAWANKFHCPTTPFVVPKETHVWQCLRNVVAPTFGNTNVVPDDDLLTCFGNVDRTDIEDT